MKSLTFSLLFTLLSCSGILHKPDPLGPAGGNKDDIPNEFPEQATQVGKTFLDKTDDYGLTNVKAYNMSIVDLNQDYYSDLVVIPSFYSYPKFYQWNIGKRKFIERKSPFLNPVKASFILFYDLNQDKVLDAIVGVLNQKTELSKDPIKIFYGNQDGGDLVFEEGDTLNVTISNSTIGLIDYNLDGKLDLFVGNWFKMLDGNPFPAPDYLFESTKDGYKDVSHLLRGEQVMDPTKAMHIAATPTYGSQICDIDQNGFPDILTVSTNRFDNKLWMNRYQFRTQTRYFENIGKTSGYSADAEGLINKQGGGRTFGVSCADYNNDGIMDIFLGELNHNYDNSGVDRSSVLTGRTYKYPPRFYRTEYFRDSFNPNWHEADRRGVWVDLNNDGRLDLIVDNSGYPPQSKLVMFEQLVDYSFENKAPEYGIDIINPISSVVMDINRDGKMDIITAQSQIRDEAIKPTVRVFENNIKSPGRSVRFFLRGERSNTHGLNATIILKVEKDGGIQKRLQNVSYSYGSLPPQNEEGVHFGLGDGEKLSSVIVRWPYSKKVNTTRVHMEKKYELRDEFDGYLNITLCESGNYLIGRRNCL